jgi:hypothetical protein
MRPLRLLTAAILLATVAGTASAQTTHWVASLSPLNEVPPAALSSGSGTFEADLTEPAHDAMTFTLTYTGLTTPTIFAHIHRGAAGVNGPVIYFLSPVNFASPHSGATDPTPSGGPTGFIPADFTDLSAGNLYVNIHTQQYTGGEVRGQITGPVAVLPSTWGRMKALFR